MLFGNSRFSMSVLVDGLPVTKYTESESNTWVSQGIMACIFVLCARQLGLMIACIISQRNNVTASGTLVD